jgi:hypothetical protein
LDVSDEGTKIWVAAKTITTSACNSNEMFRVFSKFNVREIKDPAGVQACHPRIPLYQTQPIDTAKEVRKVDQSGTEERHEPILGGEAHKKTRKSCKGSEVQYLRRVKPLKGTVHGGSSDNGSHEAHHEAR